MKHLLLLLLAACLTHPLFAQRTLGWYVGPTSAVTTVNSETGVLTGVEAGVVIDGRLAVGFESWRLLNDIEADRPDEDGNENVEFFFSGVHASYAVPLTPRLRAAPGLLVGGAEAHWREGFFDGLVGDWNRDDEHTTSLVLVPGAELSYRLLPWMHATVGANYRFVTGGESRVLDRDEMRGFTGSLGLRFGLF